MTTNHPNSTEHEPMPAFLRYRNGEREQFDSVEEALDAVEAANPGCYCSGPDCRILCWESEAMSVDDADAFAEIIS